MARIVLTDGSGKFFYEEKATKFAEETRWNGSNHISVNTNSQWHHEALYRTAGGVWILNCWSQEQGSRETYEIINDVEAAIWLSTNDYEEHEACAEEYKALEIA